MSQIFRNKKFSSYLGEQRAILDIIIDFIPNPSQTPTPSPTSTLVITPTPTSTSTPTPSITASFTPTPTNTLTQTPTKTQPAICGEQIIITNALVSEFNGTYDRVYSYTGGTFIGGWFNQDPEFTPGTSPDGNLYSTWVRNVGSTAYTISNFFFEPSTSRQFSLFKTEGSLINNQVITNYGSLGMISFTASTNIDGVLYLNRGLNTSSAGPTMYVSYPEICPTPTPTNTTTSTPTPTPTTSPAVPYQSAILEVECVGGVVLGGDQVTVDGAPYPLTVSGGTIGVAGCVNVLIRNGTSIIYNMIYGPNSQVCLTPGNTYDSVRLINFNYNPAIGLFGGYDYTEVLYMGATPVGGSVKQTAIINPPADLGNGCPTQDLDLVVTFYVESTVTPTPTPTPTLTPTSSPSGGFTPTSISGITTWFEPTLGVSISGGYVVSWTDQVGGRIANATSPTIFTNTGLLNGYLGITAPSVNIDGLQWSTLDTYSSFTIFGVTKRTDNGNPQYFCGHDGNQGIGLAYDDGSGFAPFIYDGASGMVFKGGTSPLNTPQYLSWSLSTTSGEIRQNGTQVATNSGNPNAQSVNTLFSNNNVDNSMEGTIWEVIIYDRVLTAGEISQVETYLSTKYGL